MWKNLVPGGVPGWSAAWSGMGWAGLKVWKICLMIWSLEILFCCSWCFSPSVTFPGWRPSLLLMFPYPTPGLIGCHWAAHLMVSHVTGSWPWGIYTAVITVYFRIVNLAIVAGKSAALWERASQASHQKLILPPQTGSIWLTLQHAGQTSWN